VTPAERDIERNLDDPRWGPVVVVAAALLAEDAPAQAQALLSRLLDASRDDLFRHRFVLAAHALDAAPQATLDALQPAAGRVEHAWAEFLRGVLLADSAERDPLWRQTLELVRPARLPRRALEVLAEQLALGIGRRSLFWSEDDYEQYCRTEAVDPAPSRFGDTVGEFHAAWFVAQKLGAAASAECVASALLARLDDPLNEVRYAAAGGFGSLATTALTDPILEAIVAGLGHPDPEYADDYLSALLSLGDAAARPVVLERLLASAEHPDPHHREMAAKALWLGGISPREPAVAAALARLLEDQDSEVQVEAAATLCRGENVPAACLDLVFPPFEPYEGEPLAPDLRVAHALVHGGPTEATDVALMALTESLGAPDRPDRFVTHMALLTLGAFGPTAAREPVLEAVMRHLDDEPGVRRAAAFAMSTMGPIARDLATAILAARVADPDPETRAGYLYLLSEFGFGVVNEAVTGVLLACLHDPVPAVAEAAVDAVGRLGPYRASPAIVASVLRRLLEADEEVATQAARCLGRLGSAARTDGVVSALTGLLDNSASELRKEAAIALCEIDPTGRSAATAVSVLVDCWGASSEDSSWSGMGIGDSRVSNALLRVHHLASTDFVLRALWAMRDRVRDTSTLVFDLLRASRRRAYPTGDGGIGLEPPEPGPFPELGSGRPPADSQ
jgi:HEAT repeat protein